MLNYLKLIYKNYRLRKLWAGRERELQDQLTMNVFLLHRKDITKDDIDEIHKTVNYIQYILDLLKKD